MAQPLKPHRHIHFIEEVTEFYKHNQKYKKIKYSCYVPNCHHCYYKTVKCKDNG